jgi:hypothetical protein
MIGLSAKKVQALAKQKEAEKGISHLLRFDRQPCGYAFAARV